MAKPLYAILLDGGYLTKRLQSRYRRPVTADDVMNECERLKGIPHVAGYDLLRIYYYDAAPATGAVPKPVSQEIMELNETARFRHSQSFFDQLVMKPNIALRMGRVDLSRDKWRLKPNVTDELIKGPRALTDADFDLDLNQKGVDMRIGMDMARLALRQMVRAVIVVTGDSDFVPAFKYVRREGVNVILEPMGTGGRRELREHADIVLEGPAKTKSQRKAAAKA